MGVVLRDQEDLSAHDIESTANRQTGAVILFCFFSLPVFTLQHGSSDTLALARAAGVAVNIRAEWFI